MPKASENKTQSITNEETEETEDLTVRHVLIYIINSKLKNFLTILMLFTSIFIGLTLRYNPVILSTKQTNINIPDIKKIVPVVQPLKRTYKIFQYATKQDDSYLKHVYAVLKRIEYQRINKNATNWDLLWAHDFPFRVLQSEFMNLKPQQRINHFPGIGFITSKVDLATSKSKYIPPAFKLPGQKKELLDFAEKNPNKIFVYKDNNHRNIRVKEIQQIDLNTAGNFMQEYVDKPFLVDGYKFDIGVYTIVTSIDPLRIYIYDGDVLFRYCMHEYYPFDPEDLDKYVVGDDYRPTWEIPSLEYYYNELNFTMRGSFDAYVRYKGMDPEPMWRNIEQAIATIILQKEQLIIGALTRYSSTSNFFEMMRFDFILDENLNVYLLEANMSPNLSSAHYPPNQKLYEQVLHNLFSLIGLTIRSEERTPEWERSLVVFPKECESEECRICSPMLVCQLCAPCRTVDNTRKLRRAFEEFVSRRECKRIFPPSLLHSRKTLTDHIDELIEDLSPENQLQQLWFAGKCILDESWC